MFARLVVGILAHLMICEGVRGWDIYVRCCNVLAELIGFNLVG